MAPLGYLVGSTNPLNGVRKVPELRHVASRAQRPAREAGGGVASCWRDVLAGGAREDSGSAAVDSRHSAEKSCSEIEDIFLEVLCQALGAGWSLVHRSRGLKLGQVVCDVMTIIHHMIYVPVTYYVVLRALLP